MQNNSSTPYSSYQPSMAQRLQHSKSLIAIVAVLGVTVMALAAALVVGRSDAQSDVPKTVSTVASTTPPTSASRLAADSNRPATANPVKSVPAPVVVVAKSSPATVCADCGTVQSVTAVQRQGQVNGVAVGNNTIGLGTVAGGVLGGLLGNQVGNGNGKTAATVIGVAGGAYAGNVVEKNMKKVTVYDVRVRMDDGTTRNMDISTNVPVGSKVIVEGKNLRLATAKG